MRFKSSIRNITTLTKFTASLSSLNKIAWVRLDNDQVRFTIIPEQGTQVWAVLSIDTIFETYTIQSAAPNNTINLELPLAPFHKALRSAINATSASLRLTKKDDIPLLSLTIVTNTLTSSGRAAGSLGDGGFTSASTQPDHLNDLNEGIKVNNREMSVEDDIRFGAGPQRDRETTITQDIPVRVINAATVEGLHEPRCREPDVHILLPSLLQLKSISERFNRLALLATTNNSDNSRNGLPSTTAGPRLELSANMHGELRLGIRTDALKCESKWTGLNNPELDPGQVEGGLEGLREHPSTRMKERVGEEGWAVVRVDGRDWGRVLSVGRLGGRVIACFCHEHALILYVYLSNEEDGVDDSVLTYYISSYST